MDKYKEALNNISSYEIWHYATYDDDGYCNDDDYTEYPFEDSEDINLLNELITKHDNINKGIDELINECQHGIDLFNKSLIADEDYYDDSVKAKLYDYFSHELKKLKEEGKNG